MTERRERDADTQPGGAPTDDGAPDNARRETRDYVVPDSAQRDHRAPDSAHREPRDHTSPAPGNDQASDVERHEAGPSDAARELAGLLSAGVTGQLSAPLRQLRENLAVMVETIDSHVGTAQGPTPYPWRALLALRQDLADAYLLSRRVSRTAGNLASCVGLQGRAVVRVDVGERVEAALDLVRHRVGANTEIFVDIGTTPPIRAAPGELVLALASMLLVCIESAARVDGSAISVKTRSESDRACVLIYIADNGDGAEIPARTTRFIAQISERLGAVFDGASEPARGSVFEWRIPESP